MFLHRLLTDITSTSTADGCSLECEQCKPWVFFFNSVTSTLKTVHRQDTSELQPSTGDTQEYN